MRVSRRHSAPKDEKLGSGDCRHGRGDRWAIVFASQVDAQNHLPRRPGNSPGRIAMFFLEEIFKRQKQPSISKEWKVRQMLWASRTQVPPIQCPPPPTGSCIQLWCASRKAIRICTTSDQGTLGP